MRLRAIFLFLLSLVCYCFPAFGQWTPHDPITGSKKSEEGVVFELKSGARLKFQICNEAIVHLIYSPVSTFASHPDYVVIKKEWPRAAFTFDKTSDGYRLTTSKLQIQITASTGAINYSDASGKTLATDGKRLMYPQTVNGENTYRGETVINMYGSQEGLYGLGQHQAGVFNFRGESVELSQENTNITIPLFVSTNGYGIFWNNTSRSRFNNRFVHVLYLSSEVADTIDYYFLYGPDLDKIVASYRELTGQAPMFGRWAYGFWQCKNRYKSEKEILAVAHKYREVKLPVDDIVQDWFWWNRKGEHVFNDNYPDPKGMVDDLHKNNFHLMISVWPFFEPGSKEYEEMDKKGWFIDRTKFASPPYHAGQMAVYDATNPEARKYYWNLMDKALFSVGVDAWWLDTTEPETENQEENIMLGHKVSIGSGDRYANIFPLMTTTAVYEGQRSASDKKRVFILSRSVFAGAQRNAVTAWSGDILENWLAFQRQIPAGLNYSLSGMPYWTTDIGGFISGGNLNDPQYRELYTRWFQYGAFCPIFRTHGTRNPDENELWSYGPETEKVLVQFDRLRYRMMPYIYSLAWMVTDQSYTPMRPLVMDFRDDVKAQNVGDQFLYGPAFLVNPVTEQGATERHLYLPGTTWYDFWTGEELQGGHWINAPAPIDRMPLYVRAGSIVPLGPDEQYAGEKPVDPIELRVYRGADGHFTLYEDENDNYNYEKGMHAEIPISWNEREHKLKIGDRRGSFPGMLNERTFHVVFVGSAHGVGVETASVFDQTVRYAGKIVSISAK
ncbi:Alpha-glucosidase [Candidatus Koribacter versatilis Ellin345]|uniref:Alpha-glucosidase n=1 Tax=Koribacter versatilis (strain Ellin345) TaxID=204669 RepID=Q1IT99_KORVE|nr:glycoside hydrolase family 31 protein [Candidatus Koribacter versatilis]ABF39901.1 Alpha-glucosidase [Candidatus Koribacter versatilis Ellin345]